MARRPRGAASSRGRSRRSRAIPWGALGLVALAAAALVALTQLRRAPSAPPAAEEEGVPGVEVPDARGSALPETGRPGSPRDGRNAGAVPTREPGAQRPRDVPPRTEPQRETAELPPADEAAPAVSPALPPAPSAATLVASATPRPDGRAPAGRPRVAIVLDDCGQRLDLLQRAIRIGQPLTLAVIPHLPHSRASAEAAHAAGHEVIVHQPMEPEAGDENPGEGAIRSGMSTWRIRRTLRDSLADVPHAVGLNNHMGSRATADAALMAAVLGAVAEISRERPLYFLDSRTTAATVAFDAARRAGVPMSQRDVFLDNDLSATAISAQFDLLLARAAEQGQAVGIGHLKPETIAVLEARMAADGVGVARFVFLGELVR